MEKMRVAKKRESEREMRGMSSNKSQTLARARGRKRVCSDNLV
jgi:hypothetical protein